METTPSIAAFALAFALAGMVCARANASLPCGNWRSPLRSGHDVLRATNVAQYGAETRRRVMPDEAKFASVGALRFRKERRQADGSYVQYDVGHCTSPLVSECHAVTNRHCVAVNPDPCAQWAMQATDTTRRAGFFFEDIAGASHAVSRIQASSDRSFGGDFAFLRLQGKPGRERGFATLHPAPLADLRSGRIEPVGYSADFADGRFPSVDEDAALMPVPESRQTNLIYYRSDHTLGSSGGPIFREGPKAGSNELVGLNVGTADVPEDGGCEAVKRRYSNDEASRLAVGVPVERFYSELQEFMRANPCEED